FGSRAAHRPAVGLDGIGTTRATLVGRDISAAHDDAGVFPGQVQLVTHHLPESRARALPAISLADEVGGAVVGVDDNPGIEFKEVGYWPGAGRLGEQGRARHGGKTGADTEGAGAFQEVAAGTAGMDAADGIADRLWQFQQGVLSVLRHRRLLPAQQEPWRR